MYTYLFDFDGTLVDSMPIFSKTMISILDENNIPYDSDIIKTIVPLGVLGTAKHFMGMGLDLKLDEIIAIMGKKLIKEYTYNIPAKNNVIDVLKQLKKQGASLNVLTASPHIILDVCLERLGILDLFTNVWSCDDFDTTKANPEIYIKAAEKLGVSAEEVLFLDDNINAVKTAKNAGVRVCAVYDETSKESEAQMREIANGYIYDFTELLDLSF